MTTFPPLEYILDRLDDKVDNAFCAHGLVCDCGEFKPADAEFCAACEARHENPDAYFGL